MTALNHNESDKAVLFRELLGGSEYSPLGLDGRIGGYRGMPTDGGYWCVICAKFAAPAGAEQGELFLEIMKQCAEELLRDVQMEITSDESGMIMILLFAASKDLLTGTPVREFIREIGVRLELREGLETRIGAGSVCKSCGYLAFSKSEAVRAMTRYNVSKTIQNILTYVSINYSDPDLSNGRIAKDNFLNYAYLCNQFKREMGVTLNRYIQQVRMKTAGDLLTLPNRNVLEIARMVGFTDVKYFSKCFKTNFGLTPNQYRQLYKKER